MQLAASPPAALLAESIDAEARRRFSPMGKAMVLSIAYSANIGGMATLTGTGPNLVLAGDISALYPKAPGLSFAAWIAFGLPLASLLLLASWASVGWLSAGRLPEFLEQSTHTAAAGDG